MLLVTNYNVTMCTLCLSKEAVLLKVSWAICFKPQSGCFYPLSSLPAAFARCENRSSLRRLPQSFPPPNSIVAEKSEANDASLTVFGTRAVCAPACVCVPTEGGL